MSKTALVTLCIKRDADNAKWMDAGLPSKVKYAANIGADFINITEPRLGGSVASEKYQIGGMLNKYDRIIYMDADLLIVPDAPNLFDVVPADHFGIFDESYAGPMLRTSLMAWLLEGWPGCPCPFYANNGLFVCSREHQWLFDHAALNRRLKTYEQTQMVYRLWEALVASSCKKCGGVGFERGSTQTGLTDRPCKECGHKQKIKVKWLDKCWNWMPRTWIGGPDPGWVLEPQPDPCWVHHFPCHNFSERLANIEALNERHGL